MTVILSSLKTTTATADDGAEWKAVTDWPGVRLKVRSIRSADYRTQRDLAAQKLTRRLGRLPTGPELEPELAKLYARYLLRGWEGFDEPYTPDLAFEKLTDPEFADLNSQVVWAASSVGEGEIELVEDHAKNSGAPSATT